MRLTRVNTLLLGMLAVLITAAAVRCSNGPPKPDVVAELNNLKIAALPKTYTPEQVANIEKVWEGPGHWFIKTGCFACHPVSVYDIKPITAIGPDLSLAVTDVRSRFGRELEDFFATPQGTMQLVLASVIKLTPEEKKTALAELHKAFDEHTSKNAPTNAKSN